jgi:hypothetical protein
MKPNAPVLNLIVTALLSAACSDAAGPGNVEAAAGSAAVEPPPVIEEPDPSCGDPNEAVDPTALIDDMEDGNDRLAVVAARPPAAGTIVPEGIAPAELIPGGRCGSSYAMRVTGQGFTVWGAGLGLNFVYDASGAPPYDASAYEGITFWARVGDTSTNQVRLALGDVNSDPHGGVCVEGGLIEEACWDTFGVNLSPLGTSWTRFTIPFAGLSQRGFGLHADAVETSELYTLSFNLDAGAVFDLWIDDLRFY